MTLSVFNDRDKLEQENKELKNKLEVLDLLERRESKQIDVLLAQIEEMKCCQNCKNMDTDCEDLGYCTVGVFFNCKSNQIFNNKDSKIDKWELSE